MASKPEISVADGKATLKYAVGLDSDGDGKMAASLSLVVEVDEKEAADEILQKVLKGKEIPAWLKLALGL